MKGEMRKTSGGGGIPTGSGTATSWGAKFDRGKAVTFRLISGIYFSIFFFLFSKVANSKKKKKKNCYN
jgi:hypothetical protein